MRFEDLTPEQQEMEPNEGHDLNDEQLDGIAGGARCYDDPREDYINKKDDPKEP